MKVKTLKIQWTEIHVRQFWLKNISINQIQWEYLNTTLYQIANEKNIYGWVKNINTNEVEAVFFGEEKKVDEIIKLCRKGPTSSNVVSVKIKDYKQEYFKKSFDIL